MTNPTDEEMDLLIAYALDELDSHEAERVGRLLDERPELRVTAAELRATLDKLPYALPQPDVPASLRQRALDRAVGRAARPAASAPPARGPWRRLSMALGALSAALAVIAVALVVQLGESQRQLAQARLDLDQVAAERDQIVGVVARAEVLAELRGDAGRATLLRGAGGETLLAAQLPPLPEGRVYQLWRIAGAAPESAGTFRVGEDGAALVSLGAAGPEAAGVVFAVTSEPGPQGSPAPTSDPLILGEAG